MIKNLPEDLKAEALLCYIPKSIREICVVGSHKRNAYEDISSLSTESDKNVTIAINRNGIYDILPEALFHPIDRFEGIPANEYKEKVECEINRQQIEEENARKFFSEFDRFLIELSSIIHRIKEIYSEESIISDIISDSIDDSSKGNRFIKRTMQFLPLCRTIRGDRFFISSMLRYVLREEGITINTLNQRIHIYDEDPWYNCNIEGKSEDHRIYLGREFDETITIFNISYWDDNECSETFLQFINEIAEYEQFINDYFMGIETRVRFDISTKSLPVRLSDEIYYNYLDYNTNL
ncbi:MAG: hypothetical protein ACI4AK_02115 [Lepagella sp.]